MVKLQKNKEPGQEFSSMRPLEMMKGELTK